MRDIKVTESVVKRLEELNDLKKRANDLLDAASENKHLYEKIIYEIDKEIEYILNFCKD
jgi:hypothetical protein